MECLHNSDSLRTVRAATFHGDGASKSVGTGKRALHEIGLTLVLAVELLSAIIEPSNSQD